MGGPTRRTVILGAGATVASAAAIGGGLSSRDLPPPQEPDRGPVWIAAGALASVAVLEATRWSGAEEDDGHEGHDHSHDHTHVDEPAGEHQVHAASPIGHGVWTDTVLVDLSVRNHGSRPARFSAGQFRLRVDDGLTVSFYDAERRSSTVRPGGTATTRIGYLVPPRAVKLSLEYTGADKDEPLALALRPRRPQEA